MDPPGKFGVAPSKYHWFVYLKSGRPFARLSSVKDRSPGLLPFEIKEEDARPGIVGRTMNTKVNDGWIVSYKNGEAWPWLWWFSDDGTQSYKISGKYWINGFVQTDAGLLAIHGYSQLGSEGGIIRIVCGDDGRWHAENYIPLNEEAYCATQAADGTFLVATNRRLLQNPSHHSNT